MAAQQLLQLLPRQLLRYRLCGPWPWPPSSCLHADSKRKCVCAGSDGCVTHASRKLLPSVACTTHSLASLNMRVPKCNRCTANDDYCVYKRRCGLHIGSTKGTRPAAKLAAACNIHLHLITTTRAPALLPPAAAALPAPPPPAAPCAAHSLHL